MEHVVEVVLDQDAIGGSAMGALRPRDFDMVGGGRRIAKDDYSCDRVPVTD
jgi:hypothetical protein